MADDRRFKSNFINTKRDIHTPYSPGADSEKDFVAPQKNIGFMVYFVSLLHQLS